MIEGGFRLLKDRSGLREALLKQGQDQNYPHRAVYLRVITHAGNIINLCEVGKDGKVPFQRLRGRKMHPELVELGERILVQPLDHKSLGSAQLRWQEGVFVGIRMHTGEKIATTPGGVCKNRSIRRTI